MLGYFSIPSLPCLGRTNQTQRCRGGGCESTESAAVPVVSGSSSNKCKGFSESAITRLRKQAPPPPLGMVLGFSQTDFLTFPPWENHWNVGIRVPQAQPTLNARCILFVDYAVCDKVLSHVCGL